MVGMVRSFIAGRKRTSHNPELHITLSSLGKNQSCKFKKGNAMVWGYIYQKIQ
jgi:hypothetical protein